MRVENLGPVAQLELHEAFRTEITEDLAGSDLLPYVDADGDDA